VGGGHRVGLTKVALFLYHAAKRDERRGSAMELNLAGRTVLITGGSKGIGLGCARRFAAEGANLVLVARSADQLETAAESIRRHAQVNVRTMALDLSDQAQRDRLVAAHPDIDVLVNNAGAIPGGDIFAVDDQAWRDGWELKVFGYVNLTRAYFGLMKERQRGVIINICGAGGETLSFGYIAGAAGNASLMAFSRAMGGMSTDFGVRVVAVNPGPVETDRVVYLAKQRAAAAGDESRWRQSFARMPYGRPAATDEIAPMVVFLASDLSRYISGTVVTIDGGLQHRNP
jgi:NAD(P)-dependent dehydrogenase (short-subunit alcohol dehydrogenase family)